METDLSIVSLVLEAGVVVQLVLLLLILASVGSWAVIIEKRRSIKQAVEAASEFESSFWSGGDLATLYRNIARTEISPVGMAGIFESGFREFGRLKQEGDVVPHQIVEGARRSMHVAQMREVDKLERNLAFLATVGSTSPYIGLFGTVWGIMTSFQALGGVQTATIAMVAPGITHALVATAAGLFAAIPAVIAYNRYADQVDRLEVRYDVFMEELLSIFHRNSAARSGRTGTHRAPPAEAAK
ncbi:MAG: protein TolQ [Gammaproteobacteria bacterium]|jgi:biopolymer transport protein TolQ